MIKKKTSKKKINRKEGFKIKNVVTPFGEIKNAKDVKRVLVYVIIKLNEIIVEYYLPKPHLLQKGSDIEVFIRDSVTTVFPAKIGPYIIPFTKEMKKIKQNVRGSSLFFNKGKSFFFRRVKVEISDFDFDILGAFNIKESFLSFNTIFNSLRFESPFFYTCSIPIEIPCIYKKGDEPKQIEILIEWRIPIIKAGVYFEDKKLGEKSKTKILKNRVIKILMPYNRNIYLLSVGFAGPKFLSFFTNHYYKFWLIFWLLAILMFGVITRLGEIFLEYIILR